MKIGSVMEIIIVFICIILFVVRLETLWELYFGISKSDYARTKNSEVQRNEN